MLPLKRDTIRLFLWVHKSVLKLEVESERKLPYEKDPNHDNNLKDYRDYMMDLGARVYPGDLIFMETKPTYVEDIILYPDEAKSNVDKYITKYYNDVFKTDYKGLWKTTSFHMYNEIQSLPEYLSILYKYNSTPERETEFKFDNDYYLVELCISKKDLKGLIIDLFYFSKIIKDLKNKGEFDDGVNEPIKIEDLEGQLIDGGDFLSELVRTLSINGGTFRTAGALGLDDIDWSTVDTLDCGTFGQILKDFVVFDGGEFKPNDVVENEFKANYDPNFNMYKNLELGILLIPYIKREWIGHVRTLSDIRTEIEFSIFDKRIRKFLVQKLKEAMGEDGFNWAYYESLRGSTGWDNHAIKEDTTIKLTEKDKYFMGRPL